MNVLLPQNSVNFSNNLLTDRERIVLNALKEAWENFVALGGHFDHDLTEFNYAIHLAQQKIAIRVARRADPGIWSQPRQDNCLLQTEE